MTADQFLQKVRIHTVLPESKEALCSADHSQRFTGEMY